MSWVAVDEIGAVVIFLQKPARRHHSPGAESFPRVRGQMATCGSCFLSAPSNG